MLYATRYRERSTLNYSAVGTAIIGHERTEYPRGTIIETSQKTLSSEGLVGDEEWCLDEVHRFPFREGGPLLLQKVRRDPGFTAVRMNCSPAGVFQEYTGSLYTIAPLRGGVAYTRPPESYGNTSSYGPTAWSRFKPGKPAMDVGVFLAELRDMPRMVRDLKEKCKALRSLRGKAKWKKFKASNEFLSYQFAWKPFVSDLLQMSQEAFSWRKRLDRLQKNSGVWKRVSGTVSDGTPETSDVETDTRYGDVFPILNTWYFARPNDITNQIVRSQRIWFEAKMKYFMPPINTDADRMNALRRLYGVTLTPDVVWNIMPWSWLIDWFTNAGDVISNFSTGAVDDLVAAYAFVMGYTITESQQIVRAYTKCDGAVNPVTLVGRVAMEVKRRDAASPFGFGLTVGDLTTRQLAILAALGLRF